MCIYMYIWTHTYIHIFFAVVAFIHRTVVGKAEPPQRVPDTLSRGADVQNLLVEGTLTISTLPCAHDPSLAFDQLFEVFRQARAERSTIRGVLKLFEDPVWVLARLQQQAVSVKELRKLAKQLLAVDKTLPHYFVRQFLSHITGFLFSDSIMLTIQRAVAMEAAPLLAGMFSSSPLRYPSIFDMTRCRFLSCVSVYLSIHLSLSFCLVCLVCLVSVCLVCLSGLSVCLSVCFSLSLSLCQSVCLRASVWPCVCMSVRLSGRLSHLSAIRTPDVVSKQERREYLWAFLESHASALLPPPSECGDSTIYDDNEVVLAANEVLGSPVRGVWGDGDDDDDDDDGNERHVVHLPAADAPTYERGRLVACPDDLTQAALDEAQVCLLRLFSFVWCHCVPFSRMSVLTSLSNLFMCWHTHLHTDTLTPTWHQMLARMLTSWSERHVRVQSYQPSKNLVSLFLCTISK